MEIKEIVRFSAALREKGIPASVRSTQSAFQAIELLKNSDFKDSQSLKDILSIIYIKNKDQKKEFDEAFQEILGELDEGEFKEITLQGDSKNRKDSGNDQKNSLNYKMEQMSLSFKSVKKDSKMEIKNLKEENIDFQPPLEDYNSLDLREQSLMERDINTLDFFEPELFELCQKLGRKIANQRARRNKMAKNTKIDIRRSIRKNLKYGGALIELIHTKPHIKKSQHFFLSDVSGSCDWISNWFFCMVYASQKSFFRTRFFDFDNKSVETSSALGERNLMEAFEKTREIRQKNIMMHGTSNMYTAFNSFIEQANLNHKSIVLILSDCRDWAGPKSNGRPMSAELIEYMSNVSKKVIILNPEPEIKWDVVDSCVSDYRDAGAKITEVRNLKQLAKLVEVI